MRELKPHGSRRPFYEGSYLFVQGDFGAYSILQSAELYDWDQNSWTATGKMLLLLTL